jgi:hypothetical protein
MPASKNEYDPVQMAAVVHLCWVTTKIGEATKQYYWKLSEIHWQIDEKSQGRGICDHSNSVGSCFYHRCTALVQTIMLT